MAAHRWRRRGSGSPWTTFSRTSGNSLFCTSGRRRETSSTRTDSASHTVAGVRRSSPCEVTVAGGDRSGKSESMILPEAPS